MTLEEINALIKGMQSDISTKFEEFKEESKTLHTEGKSTSDKLEELQKSLDSLEKGMESLEKKQKMEKAKASIKSNVSEVDRKQISEFCKGIKEIVEGKRTNLKSDELKSYQDMITEQKAYNSETDTEGGWSVLPFIDSAIDELVREFSPFRNYVRVVNITTDKYTKRIKNKVMGALRKKDMVNFNDATKQSNWSEVSISVEDLYAIASFTSNLIEDSSFDFFADVTQELAEDFAMTEAQEFLTGTGTGEAKGILTYASGTGVEQVEQIVTATAGEIDYDDMIDFVTSIKSAYTRNANLYMNRFTQGVLRKLKSTDGVPLWQPSLIAGQPATFLGYPVVTFPEMDNVGAGNLAVMFGDLRQAYTWVNRRGVVIVKDELTQYPDIAIKASKRSSGGLTKGEAVKILKVKAV